MPVAATSLPIIITRHSQYVYRATNPAHGPKYISAYKPNDPAAGCSTAISASAHMTVNAMSAPSAKLKITAGPASFTEIALVKKSPVPIVLPSAIMATWAELNRCCSPASRCTSSFSPLAARNCFAWSASVMASHPNRVGSHPQPARFALSSTPSSAAILQFHYAHDSFAYPLFARTVTRRARLSLDILHPRYPPSYNDSRGGHAECRRYKRQVSHEGHLRFNRHLRRNIPRRHPGCIERTGSGGSTRSRRSETTCRKIHRPAKRRGHSFAARTHRCARYDSGGRGRLHRTISPEIDFSRAQRR